MLITLAPVVTNGIGKDATGLVEGRCSNGAPDVGIALKAVLSVLIPEVERAVRASSAEGAVDGVERYIVDGMYVDDVADCGVSMALEREIGSLTSC